MLGSTCVSVEDQIGLWSVFLDYPFIANTSGPKVTLPVDRDTLQVESVR